MDLVSLIAACSFGAFDPEITRAVVTLSSYGEPWSYRIEGEPNAKVFQTPEAAIAGARQAQELGKAVRVGLGGIAVDLEAATAQPNEAMFSPCVNLTITTRRLAQAAARCKAEDRPDPEYCAVGVYFGSWQEPALDMVDAVLVQAAVQGEQAPPVIEDYYAGRSAPADLSRPPAGTGEPDMTKEEHRRAELLEGGGGLFPQVESENEEFSKDPERVMILSPGRGFGAPAEGEEGGPSTGKIKAGEHGEEATSLNSEEAKPRVVPQ